MHRGVAVLRLYQVKSPSSRVQTTPSLSLRRCVNKRYLLSPVSVLAPAAGVHSEWVNKHSAWQENWHIELQPSDVQPPSCSYYLLISCCLALSMTKGKKRSSFPGLFREATECYLIGLVSVLNSCLPFLPCMSLISCIRPSQLFLTELNPAESLIGITEHVQCLIHNAWPQTSFII